MWAWLLRVQDPGDHRRRSQWEEAVLEQSGSPGMLKSALPNVLDPGSLALSPTVKGEHDASR